MPKARHVLRGLRIYRPGTAAPGSNGSPAPTGNALPEVPSRGPLRACARRSHGSVERFAFLAGPAIPAGGFCVCVSSCRKARQPSHRFGRGLTSARLPNSGNRLRRPPGQAPGGGSPVPRRDWLARRGRADVTLERFVALASLRGIP